MTSLQISNDLIGLVSGANTKSATKPFLIRQHPTHSVNMFLILNCNRTDQNANKDDTVVTSIQGKEMQSSR